MVSKDTSAVERVNKAWDRIDAWYAKNVTDWTLPRGASDEEIDDLAKHLNLTFPEEFRVSLKRHNGVESGKWAGFKSYLLSIQDIIEEWDGWMAPKRDGTHDEYEIAKSDIWKEEYWCEGWVPIDIEDGYGLVMNLAPGPKGRLTQIIIFNMDVGPEEVIHPDYPSYLRLETSKRLKRNLNKIRCSKNPHLYRKIEIKSQRLPTITSMSSKITLRA